jgi:hypothetical protein
MERRSRELRVGHRVKPLEGAPKDTHAQVAALEPLQCDASARSGAHAGTVLAGVTRATETEIGALGGCSDGAQATHGA